MLRPLHVLVERVDVPWCVYNNTIVVIVWCMHARYYIFLICVGYVVCVVCCVCGISKWGT